MNNRSKVRVNGKVVVTSDTILHIEKKTQSEYDVLPVKDPNTLYVITGA